MTGSNVPTIHLDRTTTDDDLAYAAGRAVLVGPDDDTLPGAVAAVVGVRYEWDAGRFARFPDLRVVSRMGIGYDNVDIDECATHGVAACNAPDAPTISTAEHALALMLGLSFVQHVLIDHGLDGDLVMSPGLADHAFPVGNYGAYEMLSVRPTFGL